jgi:hypothetical protein
VKDALGTEISDSEAARILLGNFPTHSERIIEDCEYYPLRFEEVEKRVRKLAINSSKLSDVLQTRQLSALGESSRSGEVNVALNPLLHELVNELKRMRQPTGPVVQAVEEETPRIQPKATGVPSGTNQNGKRPNEGWQNRSKKDWSGSICYYCGEKGHIVGMCPLLPDDLIAGIVRVDLNRKVYNPDMQLVDPRTPGGMRKALLERQT